MLVCASRCPGTEDLISNLKHLNVSVNKILLNGKMGREKECKGGREGRVKEEMRMNLIVLLDGS